MAFTNAFGIADPLVSDIAKTWTIQTVTTYSVAGRFPGMFELAIPAAAHAVYWYVVHPYMP